MSTWGEFETEEAGLAAFGRERLNDRVAYLATVRPDGSPRVHPIAARIRRGILFVRVDRSSPKANDLLRHGRYAMHSQVLDTSGTGGEFAVSGSAGRLVDTDLLATLEHGLPDPGKYAVFELDVREAMSTEYEDGRAMRQRWRAAASRRSDSG